MRRKLLWRQKLNSTAFARGFMHCFLSGQPAAAPQDRGTHVHSARLVPCVLAQEENAGEAAVSGRLAVGAAGLPERAGI